MNTACPLCFSENLSQVLYQDNQAIISIGRLTAQPAPFVFSPIALVQCLACGFVFNSAFDAKRILPLYSSKDYVIKSIVPGEMSKSIEYIYNELAPFAGQLSRVLEIGCGQGNLARALSKLCKSMVTIDPSVQIHLQDLPAGSSHKHINEYFSYGSVAAYGPFDLIIFRHLLEHLPEPASFLKDVSRLTSDGGIVYIEVPDWDNVVDNQRFCDIFNDHFGYFQEASLRQVMRELGLSLKKSIRVINGQHMGLFFEKVSKPESSPPLPKHYSPAVFEAIYKQGQKLDSEFAAAKSVVVWGAGAHGESILGFLSPANRSKIKFYFDKDSNKQKKFVPGTKAGVVSPSAELLSGIDLVLISAVLYEDEIFRELVEGLGYSGNVVQIGHGVSLRAGKKV